MQPTIEMVLEHFGGLSPGEKVAMVAILRERERVIASDLMVIGTQWGMYPEIVAEAMAEVGLGGPMDEETRRLIHANFIRLMERIRTEFNEGGSPESRQ
jgi:hypothetical protein